MTGQSSTLLKLDNDISMLEKDNQNEKVCMEGDSAEKNKMIQNEETNQVRKEEKLSQQKRAERVCEKERDGT